jgi:hypothetical protein
LESPRMIVNVLGFRVSCPSIMIVITNPRGMKYMNLAVGATQEFNQVVLPCIGTIRAYGIDEAVASFHQTMRVAGPSCSVAWPANPTNIWTSKFRLQFPMR